MTVEYAQDSTKFGHVVNPPADVRTTPRIDQDGVNRGYHFVGGVSSGVGDDSVHSGDLIGGVRSELGDDGVNRGETSRWWDLRRDGRR